MSQESCIFNCQRCRCKVKYIPQAQDQRSSPPAITAPNQPQAPAFESISNQRIIGGSGGTTFYATSSQSTSSTPQRGSEVTSSSGSALQLGQLGHGRKERDTHGQWPPRLNEWLSENRGVPFEYLHNSLQQRNRDASNQQPSSTSNNPPKLSCPFCQKTNFKDNSKLQDHLKTHSDERPFVCPDCHSKYKFKRDLVEHCRKRCKLRGDLIPQDSHSRHLPLQSIISVATQVQQQVDDVFKAWLIHLGRPAPSTYKEMLGDGSEFERCDYSTASDRAQGRGSSVEDSRTHEGTTSEVHYRYPHANSLNAETFYEVAASYSI
ncbi:hypothetical protein EV426DRAFT_721602 [Tirmania nivea]|nr:hypothetical protein EV426DRAFT_721602 [Tirmania nivea]